MNTNQKWVPSVSHGFQVVRNGFRNYPQHVMSAERKTLRWRAWRIRCLEGIIHRWEAGKACGLRIKGVPCYFLAGDFSIGWWLVVSIPMHLASVSFRIRKVAELEFWDRCEDGQLFSGRLSIECPSDSSLGLEILGKCMGAGHAITSASHAEHVEEMPSCDHAIASASALSGKMCLFP